MSRRGSAEPATAALLRDWPLVAIDTAGDKRARGLVVCVGGSPELPGAMLLAGIIAGVAARGADATQAAVWGVYLHGTAGNRLGERVGRLGFPARELVDEVPASLADWP